LIRKFLFKTLAVVGASMLCFLISIFGIPLTIHDVVAIPDGFTEKTANVEVIVCGDSRADRQIIPAIFKEKTDLDVINIAATSQDLYTWSSSLLAAKISNKIIVISASFFQVNDGANDFSFLNLGTFSDMTLTEKLKLYRRAPLEMVLMQTRLANASIFRRVHKDDFGNAHRQINIDFYEKNCETFEITADWFNAHWWYKHPEISGIKRIFLEKAFENLSRLQKCKILIYNGPVSHSFLKYADEAGLLHLEETYDEIMDELGQKYNIQFRSFLKDSSLQKDSFYYDPQHLCVDGAAIFTEKIGMLIKQMAQ
jgi:hypothetical protein